MTTNPGLRGLALLIVLSAGALSLTGCSAFASTKDLSWSTAKAMRADDDGLVVPSLVESDATDIRVRDRLTSRGTEISWTSERGIRRDDCKQAALTGTSTAGASWWPKTVPAKGWTCNWWSVFEQGGRYYAWDHREKTA